MFYYLFITGCQYNYYDAKYITHLFTKMGYVYVDHEDKANLIIVLVCSVRQKPIDRVFGKIKKWSNLPQKPKIILTGCILSSDRKKLTKKVDLITKIKNVKENIVQLLHCPIVNKQQLNHRTIKQCSDIEFFPKNELKNTAYVPIMQGCNNYCTYCVVPYTRGPEVSRQPTEIISEIKKELKRGQKHIILLGQNVNSYSNKQLVTSKKNAFTALLKLVDKINDNFDYNFMSTNPKNFSDELVDFLPRAKKWNRQLHLPLQSGDDKILKKMNRGYTNAQYLRLISKLKCQMSNLKTSTDIIVGFCGETKKQFQNTVDLCKKISFDKAFIAQYSPRPETLAYKKYKDNVHQDEKKRRWNIINNLINKNS